ncbi:MAG: tungstate ABC transporter substrate-binding protein WtpA [Bacteroidetes bacterium HGW-Bacteroidetes-17]|jgi:molybdate/tungstate transport system substrate-binding protein|nr:MAG: tungstate ABC transporter substrate-binding protein WtpA [Bacteroidetes bacterium HGW-Bacteroidetes-17]
MNFSKIKIITGFLVLSSLLSSCGFKKSRDDQKLIIFHAGSLSVPVKEVIDAFNKENPEISVLIEAAGSRDCARKITDLNKECDVMASADYTVIDELLIPEFADWNIRFASNEMVIVYTENSHYADQIDSTNWCEILLKEDVTYGRSDPNSDPCGYRTVLVSKLAELHYQIPGFSESILAKNQNYIRPKETDLLALLEINTLDYVFIYRSVAVQHNLKYILLPSQINLENPGYADFYKLATVKINGKRLGETITKVGEPMIYGLTVPKNAPHKENALKFVDYLLSTKGMAIMEKNGQPSIVPFFTDSFKGIPESLKKYALEKQ